MHCTSLFTFFYLKETHYTTLHYIGDCIHLKCHHCNNQLANISHTNVFAQILIKTTKRNIVLKLSLLDYKYYHKADSKGCEKQPIHRK